MYGLTKAVDLATLPHICRVSHCKDMALGQSVMELAAMLAGEPVSITPTCVCPVIGSFLHLWNFGLHDHDGDRETLFRPLLPLLISTRSTEAVEKRRRALLLDWLIRQNTAAWLRHAELTSLADRLGTLPEITDSERNGPLLPLLNEVLREALECRELTMGSVRHRSVAGDAVCGSGTYAARGTLDWCPAADAAMETSRIAAEMAAYYVISANADCGAYGRSMRIARLALRPTQRALQESAIRLVRCMIGARDDTIVDVGIDPTLVS